MGGLEPRAEILKTETLKTETPFLRGSGGTAALVAVMAGP
jgi:hypothetical protein